MPDVVGKEAGRAVEAIRDKGLIASFEEPDPDGCTVTKQDAVGRVPARTKVVLVLECERREEAAGEEPTATSKDDVCGTAANPTPTPACPGEGGEGTTIYRVRGRTWAAYSEQQKLDAARLFVRNNPNDCRDVDPAPLP